MKERPIWVRYAALGCMVILLFALLGGRLVQWQLLDGASFLEESENSSSFSTVVKAARGELLDSAGRPLITNRTVYNLVFNALEMKRNQPSTMSKGWMLPWRQNPRWAPST